MFSKKNGVLLLLVISNACSSVKDSPKYLLTDGDYQFRQHGTKYKKASVYLKDDSVRIIFKPDNSEFTPDRLKEQVFVRRSFDIDVITVPFKFRPITAGLPRQLTTEFNGNIYLGYRIDRFVVKNTNTPFGWKKSYKHRGVTIGGFGGLGTTSVTPWTTNYQVTDEYNGFILTRGVAIMAGVNNLTFGVGVGWDYLTDRDKDLWIYQNRPWVGLTVGLNLN